MTKLQTLAQFKYLNISVYLECSLNNLINMSFFTTKICTVTLPHYIASFIHLAALNEYIIVLMPT